MQLKVKNNKPWEGLYFNSKAMVNKGQVVALIILQVTGH